MSQHCVIQKVRLYSSYFKLHVRWLRVVTRITYLSKLIGMPSLAVCLKLELFRIGGKGRLPALTGMRY
ncbi:hypothetical protein C5E22_18830 [Pectobacterium parmentieri]|uniref:Uncharacterized protein n=1 Tax=Pectobacterium parmentieri TaxID=1905730 RepID=A0A8B3F444_PECPM|nr:hypothetical protein C5E24_03675 [Pectobacterium parmentieri]AYH20365.1 hypothetical protein C5E22_18830 [Pectobacterium parmentieri]AYH35241.1 hypothetical protein C5E17_03840 [Pectobacterium parmentieri]AZS55307.1 hypothetical protein C5E18_03675 [Pectobacterium parmentieri]RKO73893.1 hypothetical protein C5E00_21805 [Pectobacterium parmentieri]